MEKDHDGVEPLRLEIYNHFIRKNIEKWGEALSAAEGFVRNARENLPGRGRGDFKTVIRAVRQTIPPVDPGVRHFVIIVIIFFLWKKREFFIAQEVSADIK
ncbi:MAG: hypothetical protein ACYCYR_04255 [Desulfobulbaceae bacterium]